MFHVAKASTGQVSLRGLVLLGLIVLSWLAIVAFAVGVSSILS